MKSQKKPGSHIASIVLQIKLLKVFHPFSSMVLFLDITTAIPLLATSSTDFGGTEEADSFWSCHIWNLSNSHIKREERREMEHNN